MPDPSPSNADSLKLPTSYSSEEGVEAGHSGQFTPGGCLANAPQMLVAPLQSVLRSAARVVLRCPRRAGLTQLIFERLHWLPLPERIMFKLATLTYKCISGWAPD